MIREYSPSDRDRLLDLLLQLHGPYKHSVVPPELLPFGEDKDLARSFRQYFSEVEQGQGEQFMTLVAEDQTALIVGFVIGSVEDDRWDLLSPAGLLEDWYVTPDHRGEGLGEALYRRLEDWFRSKGCKQVRSDTWWTNQLSRSVHEKLGFVEYGVELRKRL